MGGPAALPHLAEDWLTAKAMTAGSTTGNSDRARRQDLARWGRVLRQLDGHDGDGNQPFDIDRDLHGLSTASLLIDNVISALEQFRRSYKASTLQRMCSTLRSFCRWLATRGHLDANPFDDEILHVTYRSEPEVRAFSPDDVEAMIETAKSPSASVSSAWPARDAAMIDVLRSLGCGRRSAVRCRSATSARRIARSCTFGVVRRATSAARYHSPRHTTDRLDRYLAERTERGIRCGPRTELFVRNDATAFSTDALYHLVKRIALAAGASLPDDALVHGLRHHFGVQLAIRGVPPATLQQLMGHTDPRTTALYTLHASLDLVNALDDAGWLARRI